MGGLRFCEAAVRVGLGRPLPGIEAVGVAVSSGPRGCLAGTFSGADRDPVFSMPPSVRYWVSEGQ
jgi:hypothetical protein